MSYRGIVTDSFVENAQLNFDDMADLCDTDWLYSMDEYYMIKKVLPNLSQYMDADGEIDIEESLLGALKGLISGIGDLVSLKKNLKKFCRKIYKKFVKSIPSKSQIRGEAYERIVEFIKQ